MEAPVQTAKQLPEIGYLFRHSWDVLKATVKDIAIFQLFVFGLILILGSIVIGIIFGAAIANGIGLVVNAPEANTNLFLIFLVGTLIIGTVLSIIIGSVYQTGMILIIANNSQKLGTWGTFKKSLSFVWPLFVTGLLSFAIVFGGFFVFILPGVIFYVFLLFYSFEVILAGRKGLDALRGSVGIFSANRGGIIGRILLLWLLNYGVEALISTVSRYADQTGALLLALVNFVISLFLGWYSFIYMIELYKEAKTAAGDKKGSLLWMGIVSAIGWVIAGIILFSMGSLVINGIRTGEYKRWLQSQPAKELERKYAPGYQDLENQQNQIDKLTVTPTVALPKPTSQQTF